MSEAEICLLFDWARSEIDKIETQAHGAKKRIVQDLALKLEGLLPTESICEEITHQLAGKISERTVRDALEDKYKNKIKQNAAKESHKSSAAILPQAVAQSEPPMIAATGETVHDAYAEVREEIRSTLQTPQLEKVAERRRVLFDLQKFGPAINLAIRSGRKLAFVVHDGSEVLDIEYSKVGDVDQ